MQNELVEPLKNKGIIKLIIADSHADRLNCLNRIFAPSAGFQVVGNAENSAEILNILAKTKANAMILSIDSPELDVYDITVKIMETYPLPIILLAINKTPSLVVNSFRAMRAGAMAMVDLPELNGLEPNAQPIQKTLLTVTKIARIGLNRPNIFTNKPTAIADNIKHDSPALYEKPFSINMDELKKIRLIAIGASTGGPAAIRFILNRLDSDFSLPILIVQHIVPGFLKGLVSWLSHETGRTIVIPHHGEQIYKSRIYFAPDNVHMGVNRKGLIILEHGPSIHGVKPSISFLFGSLAQVYGNKTLAILLTGMGVDGAEELMMIKQQGGVTIAQDENSSVVYGMPKEAIRLNAANYVIPPIKIVQMLNMIRHRASTTPPTRDRVSCA